MFLYTLYNNSAVNLGSQICNCSHKYFPLYVLCIQPDDGCLASQNTQLLLILICESKLCLDARVHLILVTVPHVHLIVV